MPYITVPTDLYFARVREQLAANGQAYVRVTGISMSPLLRHLQDQVLIVPAAQVQRGDIVLYDRRNGRYALHRVISVRDDTFSMAGDNQRHMETGLSVRQIVGKAACIIRGERRLPTASPGMRVYSMLAVAAAYVKLPAARSVKLLGKLIRRKK